MIDDNRKNLSREDYQTLKEALREQTQNWDIEWQWDEFLKTEWKDIEMWVDAQAVKDFQSRILKIENEEKNVGKVAWKKVNKWYADEQQRAVETKREKIIEEIWEYYWLDQYEAAAKYDELLERANVNNVKYQVATPEYEYLKNRNDLPWESYLVVNQIITRLNWWENIKSVIKDTLEWRERMLERYERILKNWDETWDYWVIWEYQLKRQIEKYKNDISVLKTMDESDFWKKTQDPLKSIAVDKTWQKSLWQQVNELRTLWLDEATIDKYVQDVIANPEKAEKITINTMKQAKNYIVWQEPKKWAENVREWLDKPKWWWTESEIRNTLKNIEADKWTDAIYKAVNEYDDVDDFMAHAFYHGTAHYFAGKPSITLSPSEAMRLWWGWYWERYYAISLSKSKKIASNFWSQEAWWWVSIYPVLLKKNAKVIELPKTTDSIDLNDFITKLWDDWIDAVWIWDKNAWEQELAILNPKAIVNTQKSDYYKMFWLWTEKNPINIKDRAEFERMYNDVKNATTEEEKATSANNIMYQKYWTAWAWEKWVNAIQWLNIRNFKNWKSVKELADNYWIKTHIVQSISTPEWQKAYGMYWDRVITLARDLKESTVPHELLHATFDMVDQWKKNQILDGIKNRLKVDDVQAEEWLADNFSEYYRTGKFDTKSIPTTLSWKIKQFFQQIKEYIDWTYANRKEIQNLFDDIIDGKLEWEYWAYSDPKFQSVWHGSRALFDKFDSSHMWEWEWWQAHGWWHYVTKNKDIATWYAKLWSSGKFMWELIDTFFDTDEWKTYNNLEKAAIYKVWEYLWYWYEPKEALKRAKTEIKTWKKEDKESWKYKYADSYLNVLDNLDSDDFWSDRNLYNVEIPDPIKKDTPTWTNYIEEDWKISYQQIEKIAEWLEKYDERGNWGKNRFLEWIVRDLEDASWWWDDKLNKYVTKWNISWRNLYKHLENYFNSDKQASKYLESLWYDGIHYLWWRDWECYVIFNDDSLNINNRENL